MKKLLLFIAILISGMGLFAQSVGDNTIVDYEGYSLKFTVTNLEPAECEVYCSTHPTSSTEIVIPSKETISGKEYTVTSIGEYAFSNCDNLTSIELPNGVTSIGFEAFWGCSSLTSIEIPNSVTSIGDDAFSNCYITSITVEDGNPVYDSRNNCNAIIETETNTLIAGCMNTLIPNSVTSIGESAFSHCSNLTSIEIPNSVTSIGNYAFYYCYNLTSIEIPNSVTSIGDVAFTACYYLTSITVEDGNPVYDSRNNCNAIIETETNTLIAGCQNTLIPNSVTSIGDYAFFDFSNLTSIEIPNSVTSIGYYAFSHCYDLTSIEIPNSVTSIENYAFQSCSNLTSITVEDGNPVYDSRNNCNAIIETETNTLIAGCNNTIIPNTVTIIGRGAFSQCSNLTSIEIPNSVTSIGDDAFYNCSNLTSIELPSGVTSIGYSAFNCCYNLTSIEIPNGVTSIGYNAFTACYDLTSIYCYAENVPKTYNNAFNNCPSDMTIYVPAQSVDAYKAASPWNKYTIMAMEEDEDIVVNVGDNTIIDYEGYSLKFTVTSVEPAECAVSGYEGEPVDVAIPSTATISGMEFSVTSIGNYAFDECSSLTSIEIPSGVTSIGGDAFYGCSSLTSIEIPSSVTSIGGYAFEGCSSLTSIEIPSGVTFIGVAAFTNCSSLTSIEIPSGVTFIGVAAFTNCSSLTSIEIPNSVTSIGVTAFANCSSLTSIEIPSGVTSIGNYAFYNCYNLTSIYCYAENVPETGGNDFDYCPSDMIIYVPAQSVDAYKAAWHWKNCTIKPMGDKIEDYESYSLHYIITNEEPAECEVICGTRPTVPTEIAIPSTVIISEQTEQTEVVIGAEGSSSSEYIPTYEYYNYSVTQQIYTAEEMQVSKGKITSVAFRQTESVSDTRTLDVYMLNTDVESFEYNNWFEINSANPVFSGTVYYPAAAGEWLNLEFEKPFEYEGGNVVLCVVDKTGSYTNGKNFDTFNAETNRAMYVYRDDSPYDLSNLPSGNMISDVNVVKFVTTEGKLYTVTSIGNDAFFYCDNLTSIEIPNSVTSIGNYAFGNCYNLTSIEIPNSVTSIGERAFSDCTSLTSIEIPNSVTSIGNSAFSYCDNLTSIEIPNSVTSIGNQAFYSCDNLTSITVEEGNPVYDSRNNCNAIIETETNTLIAGCQNTIIPNSVTSIGEWAFSGCTSLTSIEIPNSVTSIGNNAFFACTSLTSIEIPNSVTSIGYYAFYWCRNLTSIEIPNSVTSIGNEAFYECDHLTSIEIPNSVTSIGNQAFGGCNNLTSIEIPNSVTSIGYEAFYYCTSLTSIYCYAENVPETGNYAFNYCPSDMVIYVPAKSLDAYKAASPWNNYTIEAIGEIENHWTPDESLYANNMSVIGLIQIDGVNQNSTSLEIGAFCGEEVRGSQLVQYIPALDKYLVFLTIHGEGGEEISFKLYDHSIGEELDLRSPEAITFTVNGTLGSVTSPYILNFNNMVEITAVVNPSEAGVVTGTGIYAVYDTATLVTAPNEGFAFKNWTVNGNVVSTDSEYSFVVTEAVELVANYNYVQTRELKSGWSWFSSFIEFEGEEGLEMMEYALGENGLQIKNQTEFVVNSDGAWYGSLMAANSDMMFMLETSAPQTFTLVGPKVNPEEHPLTVGTNWRWISYPLDINLSVDEALATIVPQTGDYIKSKNAFSQYYEGAGWLGALSTMNPGEGYMYQNVSGTTKTLVYPSAPTTRSTRENVTAENNYWVPEAGKFATNMSVIAVVESNGIEMSDYEVAAFVGDEVRGSARPIYIEALDKHMIFMTVYGSGKEEITFKYYDINADAIENVTSREEIVFADNATYGSIENAIVLTCGVTGIGENDTETLNVYPNPANVNAEISLGMTYDRVEVYNAIGVKVAEYAEVNKIGGIETAGVYVIKVMNDEEARNCRIVIR